MVTWWHSDICEIWRYAPWICNVESLSQSWKEQLWVKAKKSARMPSQPKSAKHSNLSLPKNSPDRFQEKKNIKIFCSIKNQKFSSHFSTHFSGVLHTTQRPRLHVLHTYCTPPHTRHRYPKNRLGWRVPRRSVAGARAPAPRRRRSAVADRRPSSLPSKRLRVFGLRKIFFAKTRFFPNLWQKMKVLGFFFIPNL